MSTAAKKWKARSQERNPLLPLIVMQALMLPRTAVLQQALLPLQPQALLPQESIREAARPAVVQVQLPVVQEAAAVQPAEAQPPEALLLIPADQPVVAVDHPATGIRETIVDQVQKVAADLLPAGLLQEEVALLPVDLHQEADQIPINAK